jgi:hypothetical protein
MIQQDMFGKKRISIPDNPTLEKVAEMILNLSDQYPEMLDGNKISDIDRNIQYVVWMENGLRTILQSDWATTPQDRINEFEKWHKDSSKCINSDLLTRARRYLLDVSGKANVL